MWAKRIPESKTWGQLILLPPECWLEETSTPSGQPLAAASAESRPPLNIDRNAALCGNEGSPVAADRLTSCALAVAPTFPESAYDGGAIVNDASAAGSNASTHARLIRTNREWLTESPTFPTPDRASASLVSAPRALSKSPFRPIRVSRTLRNSRRRRHGSTVPSGQSGGAPGGTSRPVPAGQMRRFAGQRRRRPATVRQRGQGTS